MSANSIRLAIGFLILVSLSALFLACGGGPGGSSGGGTNPPPAPAEFLYGTTGGQIMVFNINTSTGVPTPAGGPASTTPGFGIAATPSKKFLYVADDGVGGVDGYSISQNGSLTALANSPFSVPNGAGSNNLNGAVIDPAGKFIYVTNLGAETVAGFTINSVTGALTPIVNSPFPAGSGPSQAVVDPSGKFLYVSDHSDPQGSISGFSINSSTGELTPLANSPFPTIRAGEPDGLLIDPTGKFLFTILTTSNSVAVFSIDQTSGELTAVPNSPFLVGFPSFPIPFFITMDPAGKFLYALGIQDGKIYALSINASTGALTPISGSPFDTVMGYGGVRPLIVDPSGKFLYTDNCGIVAFNINATTGALSPVSGSPFFCQSRTVNVVGLKAIIIP